MVAPTKSAIALTIVVIAVVGVFAAVRLSPGDGDGMAGRSPPGPPPADAPVAGPGRVAGYVRDVNGNAVSRTKVEALGEPAAAARTDSTGRYELELSSGSATVVARHPDFAAQQVPLRNRPSGGRLDFSLAATEAGAAGANSADRLYFWANCDAIAGLGDDGVDRLIELGVDGFVCSFGRLPSLGGTQAFTDRADIPRDEAHGLQRALAASAVMRRARSGALRMYLGFWASSALNAQTPFAEWFDDATWSNRVLPEVRELAGSARSLGFAGLAIDQELYPFSDDAQPSWSWAYPGSERPEDAVRAKVNERGRQLMAALLEGFPGLELAAYDTQLPETWSERVQQEVNDQPGAYGEDVRIDLWDGLSSVQGYSAIRWFDAIFYKTPHLTDDWATALRYNANSIYSLLSRRFANWSYAASRLHVTPFSWVDKGVTEFEAARPPDYVARQLRAFRAWGMGGSFANFAYRGFGFDYEPYADALRHASTPAVVDRQHPALAVGRPEGGSQLELAGTASDDSGIRVVRWHDDAGRSGVAQIDPVGWPAPEGGDWRASWRLEGIPIPPGGTRLTLVAEDLKGLATERTLTVPGP